MGFLDQVKAQCHVRESKPVDECLSAFQPIHEQYSTMRLQTHIQICSYRREHLNQLTWIAQRGL